MKKMIASVCVGLALVGYVSAAEPGPEDPNPPVNEAIEIEDLGFSFHPIRGWHVGGGQALVKNFDQYELDEAELNRILATRKGSRTIASFMRNDPRVTPGVIPTVNVVANPAQDTSEAAVKAAASAVVESLRRVAEDVKVVEEVAPVSISESTAYGFVVEFGVKPKEGALATIRSRTYVIPRGVVLLQVSMSEAIPAQESATFDAFLKGIRLEDLGDSSDSE